MVDTVDTVDTDGTVGTVDTIDTVDTFDKVYIVTLLTWLTLMTYMLYIYYIVIWLDHHGIRDGFPRKNAFFWILSKLPPPPLPNLDNLNSYFPTSKFKI